jgi:hypothetical protein
LVGEGSVLVGDGKKSYELTQLEDCPARAGGVAQVVECLPSKCTCKKKKKV